MSIRAKRPAPLFLFILSGIIAWTILGSSFADRTITPGSALAQEFTPYYYTLVRQHQRVDGNVPDDAVIFIGDSMIQGLAVAAVAERAVNYGISGDTTAGVLKRLPLYHSLKRARGSVMLVGVNDLGIREVPQLIDNYRNILELLPQDRMIIVCAILPIDEDVLQFPSGNRSIQLINAHLKHLCEQFGQITFINPGRYLADEDGNLKKRFHVGDGIHLNRAGYAVLIDNFRSVLNDS